MIDRISQSNAKRGDSHGHDTALLMRSETSKIPPPLTPALDLKMVEDFLSRVNPNESLTLASIGPSKEWDHENGVWTYKLDEKTGRPKIDIRQGLTFEKQTPGDRILDYLAWQPAWDRGAPKRVSLRSYLIREDRNGSNLYYSANMGPKIDIAKPRFGLVGSGGRLKAADIRAIRALVFDIDWKSGDQTSRLLRQNSFVALIGEALPTSLRPSMIIATGGGLHILYLLDAPILISTQEAAAEKIAIVENLIRDIHFSLVSIASPITLGTPTEIECFTGIERIWRLPGTVNRPTDGKREAGAVDALAHVLVDYGTRANFNSLRLATLKQPQLSRSFAQMTTNTGVHSYDKHWPIYRKAAWCCEFVRDRGIGRSDGPRTYQIQIMFPLLSLVDELIPDHEMSTFKEQNGEPLSSEQAEELWLLAMSTAAGPANFTYQVKWDRELARQRRMVGETSRRQPSSFGSLASLCQTHGAILPWSREGKDALDEADTQRQIALISAAQDFSVYDEDELLSHLRGRDSHK